MSGSRTLIACIGFRDPVYDPADEVRSADEDRRHRNWEARLRSTDFKASVSPLRWGPLGTALASFKRLKWQAERLVLLYAPDEVRMNPRVRACKKALPAHFLGLDVRPHPLDGCDVGDYASACRFVHAGLGKVNMREAEVRVLLGPGTPQLNLALALAAVGELPGAELWQVKHPAEVARKPRLASRERPYVERVRFGNGGLPAISLSGGPTARELSLEREVAGVKARLARSAVGASDSSEEAGSLVEGRDAYERARLRSAIAKEREDALQQRRAPKRAKAARLLGLGRQTFNRQLTRLGVDWG